MFRNHRLGGHWALSDQGGVVLAYFKAAEIELCRRGRSADRYIETSLDPARREDPHTIWERIDARLRERLRHWPEDLRRPLQWRNLAQGTKTHGDSFEVSAALTRIGLDMMLEDPVATILCAGKRCLSLLVFPLELAIRPPRGVPVDRLQAFLKALPYGLLILGVVWRLFRHRWSFAATYFPLAVTIALLLASTPQLDPRFRVPMIPFLLSLAFLPAGGDGERPSARRTQHSD
ncbi:MAG: hypothetical protein D6788_06650 [Planctomycetota bacterium]|nr:MAG: hypothetical protein D6788_06650 [Planctomycetota bacterium]